MIFRFLPHHSVRAHVITIILGIAAGWGILTVDPQAGLVAGKEAKAFAESRIIELSSELDEIVRLQNEFAVDIRRARIDAISEEITRMRQLRLGSPLARRLVWVAVVCLAFSSFYGVFVAWGRSRSFFSRYTARGFMRDLAYIVMPLLILCTLVGVLCGLGVGMYSSLPIADERWHVAHILDHDAFGFSYMRSGTTYAQLGMSLGALGGLAAIIVLLVLTVLSKPKKSASLTDNIPKVHAIDCISVGAGALLLTLCVGRLEVAFALIAPAILAALAFMFIICVAVRLIFGRSEYGWLERIWISIAAAAGFGEIARLPVMYASFDEVLLRCRGLFVFTLLQRGATAAAFSCVLLLMLRMTEVEAGLAHYLVLGGAAALAAIILGRTVFGLALVFLMLAPRVLWEPEYGALLALATIALVPVCALSDTMVSLTLVASQNKNAGEEFTLPGEE